MLRDSFLFPSLSAPPPPSWARRTSRVSSPSSPALDQPPASWCETALLFSSPHTPPGRPSPRRHACCHVRSDRARRRTCSHRWRQRERQEARRSLFPRPGTGLSSLPHSRLTPHIHSLVPCSCLFPSSSILSLGLSLHLRMARTSRSPSSALLLPSNSPCGSGGRRGPAGSKQPPRQQHRSQSTSSQAS